MPQMAEKTKFLQLDELARDPQELKEQLREAGGMLLVKSNGKPACVVLGPKTYERVMARLGELEDLEAITQGLKDIDEGRTRPAAEVFDEIRRKYKLPPRKR